MAKITFDFIDGEKREFTLSEDYANKLYFDLRDITNEYPHLGRYENDKD